MSQKHEMILKKIRTGESIEFKEGGNSMTPIIKSREPITLSPVDTSKLEAGDIVFSRVRGNYITSHIITAIDGNRVQISNNHGRVNGWTTRDRVYAIVSAINGRPLPKAQSKLLRNI